MAYPMIQCPTFGEFRDRLVNEFGCRYKELPKSSKVVINDKPQTVYYIERDVNGETPRVAIALKDNERVSPSVIRSTCAALKLDPKAFGLVIG